MKSIDRASAEHYTWAQVCDGWHLVKRADMSVIAERVPAGGSEKRHYHAEGRQFFYILKGMAVIQIEGECVELSEGQGLEIGPECRHQFMTRSDDDVHFLVISHPNTRDDRVEV